MSRTTNDPIADYLTRIRNAINARHRKVDIPASKMKRDLSRLFKETGFIRDYLNIEDDKQGLIRLYLKVDRSGRSAITGMKRVSRPGLRNYVGVGDIPRVRNGMGVAIMSTPKGVMTGQQAKKENVGGEVLCYIW